MMKASIQTFPCPNGQFLRVQAVSLDSWSRLSFLTPPPSDSGFDSFCKIYRQYIIPTFPWFFGNVVLFRIPADISVPSPVFAETLTAAAVLFRKDIRIRHGMPHFGSEQARSLWQTLEKRNCIQIVCGKRSHTTFIGVRQNIGYLTEAAPSAPVKVNSSFFIMDPFDCATIHDHIGTPIGLMVKDGVVENPPMYEREALMVNRDGSVQITMPRLSDLTIDIGSEQFIPGENAQLYTRPQYAKTPKRCGTWLVIIGRRVVSVHTGGRVPVPASGFVLQVDGPCSVKPGDAVIYRGLEDVVFGIQVGNSILKNGIKTTGFISRFYNIRRLEPVPFPPSLYPLDFENARAARIALGADRDGKPMLLWAEGAGKLGHIPGQESCGATLSDMARVCEAVGMYNAVNLDGGGSAQMLVENMRYLRISDRNPGDFSEAERPVPVGLMVE